AAKQTSSADSRSNRIESTRGSPGNRQLRRVEVPEFQKLYASGAMSSPANTLSLPYQLIFIGAHHQSRRAGITLGIIYPQEGNGYLPSARVRKNQRIIFCVVGP